MHEDFYDDVEEMAKADSHLPTEVDVANFEADAPVRLMSRVVRNATPSRMKCLCALEDRAPTESDCGTSLAFN